MKGTLNVWLANDSPIFRNGLKRALRKSRFSVKRSGAVLSEVVHPSSPQPAVVILGSVVDPGLEGLIRRVRGDWGGSTRFVMLSDEQGQSGFPRALIDAVIPKDIPTQALVHFLEIVWLGQPLFLNCHERWAGGSKGNYKSKPYHTAPSVEIDLRRWSNLPEDTPAEFAVQCASPAGNGSDKPPLAKASSDEDPIGLSDRETEIIQCLRQGASNKIIARQLQISEATVKVHIKSLLKKLRVRNRTQAAIWATEARLSEPPQCALSALHQSPEKVLPVSTAHDR